MIPQGESFVYLKEEQPDYQSPEKDRKMETDLGPADALLGPSGIDDHINIGDKGDPCDKPIKEPASIISLDKVPRYSNLFISVHPFILHGYRIHHSLSECLKSMFTLHNETLNIWTHFLPFIGFLVLFIYDMASKIF
jgi:hypothetical protein